MYRKDKADIYTSPRQYSRSYLTSICKDILLLCIDKENSIEHEHKLSIINENPLDRTDVTSYDHYSMCRYMINTNLSSKHVGIVMGVFKVLQTDNFFYCHSDLDRDEISKCIIDYLYTDEIDMCEYAPSEKAFLYDLMVRTVIYTDQVSFGTRKNTITDIIKQY